MAEQRTDNPKFLSPAHFQVIPRKKNTTEEEKKLLPPGAYEKISSSKVSVEKQRNNSKDELSKAKNEVDNLRGEIQLLKEQLEKSKELKSSYLKEEKRQNYSLRGLDGNLQKLDELEAENESLLSEHRKQQAIINKLRNDLKQIKQDYMEEIEKLDNEVGTCNSTIRQLKQELKEKDRKYEEQLENLKALLKAENVKVKELKSELHNTRKQIRMDRDNFEDVISQHATQKYQDIKALEDTLKNYKIKYVNDVNEINKCIAEKSTMIETLQEEIGRKDVEIKKLQEETEVREKKLQDKMEQCRVDIASSQEMFESTSNELKFTLEKAIESHNEALEEFKEKVNNKDRQIKEKQNTIEQLRAYIGENLPNAQLERIQNENKQLGEKYEVLEQENKNLISNIQFMKIRLQSLNEILTLQENELNKALLAGENARDSVLTKWREKVFTLLVQLKSQEIIKDNDNIKCKQMVSELEAECASLKHNINILSHTIADRNAELQLEHNRAKSLESELAEKQASEKRFESMLMESQYAVCKLHENSTNMMPFVKQVTFNMTEAFAKLDGLSQRVSFATGRVQFVQGLLACRQEKTKWEKEMKGSEEDPKTLDENQQAPSKELLDEIARLTQERDMLTSQAFKDAELLECRVENVRAEYEDKISEILCKLEQIKVELSDEKQRSSALSDKVLSLQSDLQESNEALENLKIDLAKHYSDAEKKLNEVIDAKQATFVEELADLEKQLNRVRGEHTKTVIALRQAEHQISREKEKAKEQIVLQQKEFDMKSERLEEQNRNLEKERNMLMATVRQEGLLVAKQRPKPYQHVPEETDVDQEEKENKCDKRTASSTRHKYRPAVASEKVQQKTKSMEEHEELSIASALHDLKFLSEALLNMQDDQVEHS